jgi:fructose-1,6-bisphosphatase/inositol monophosphatase family enzyme
MCGWGDAFGYYLVASGRVEGMIDPGASVFDIAPMKVVIAEAGGTLKTFRGGGSFASNKVVESDLVTLFKNIGLEPVESDG